MKKKFILIITAFLSSVLIGCSNSNDNSNSHNPDDTFVYSSQQIISDIINIVTNYNEDVEIKKTQSNEEQNPEQICYYDAMTNIYNILSKSKDYWLECENLNSININNDCKSDSFGTSTYNFNKINNGYDFTLTYLANNSITKHKFRYIMSFYDETFCVEYWQDSGYSNDNHYFVELKKLEQGLFFQYYYKSYSLNTETLCQITQFLYNDNGKLFFNSNANKNNGSTMFKNMDIVNISNFILPSFEYYVV